MHKTAFTTLTAASLLFAGKFDSAVRSFESAPGYVKPAATILGTFGSTGWTQRSFIPKQFSGSFSIPVNFTVINDDDRIYSGVYVDSGLIDPKWASHPMYSEYQKRAYKPYTAPTMFGTASATPVYKSIMWFDGSVSDSSAVMFSDGIENIAEFNWLPLPSLQAEFSAFYTSVKMRWIGVPTPSLGIHLPGWGIQHDCNSFLPELPVNISLFGNFAMPIVNWSPGEGITGTLEMRGFSTFSGIIIGRELKRGLLDFMIEAGWEHSTVSTGGELIITADQDTVRPNMTLEGNNKLRVGIVGAFNPGSKYRASAAVSAGAEHSFNANILSFRFGDTKSERGESESRKTEPVKTEPVKTEPVKTEPVKTEPVKTEPVKTEPAKTEPAKTEPVKTEPDTATAVDSVKSAIIDTAAVKTDSIKIETDTVKTDSAAAEPAVQNAPAAEPESKDAPKAELIPAESVKKDDIIESTPTQPLEE